MDKITIVPCWYCKGRIAVIPACATCEGHGCLRVTYSTDICGEQTMRIEPQPDAPLPLTPSLNQMNARKAARRAAAAAENREVRAWRAQRQPGDAA